MQRENRHRQGVRMINITFYGQYYLKGLKVEGHAGYSEAGTDIVCAAVSTLVSSFLFYSQEKNAKILKEKLDLADTEIEVCDTRESIAAAYDMTKLGIEYIAATYPDYVKIFNKFPNGEYKF